MHRLYTIREKVKSQFSPWSTAMTYAIRRNVWMTEKHTNILRYATRRREFSVQGSAVLNTRKEPGAGCCRSCRSVMSKRKYPHFRNITPVIQSPTLLTELFQDQRICMRDTKSNLSGRDSLTILRKVFIRYCVKYQPLYLHMQYFQLLTSFFLHPHLFPSQC
jgi:hypothetical protein